MCMTKSIYHSIYFCYIFISGVMGNCPPGKWPEYWLFISLQVIGPGWYDVVSDILHLIVTSTFRNTSRKALGHNSVVQALVTVPYCCSWKLISAQVLYLLKSTKQICHLPSKRIKSYRYLNEIRTACFSYLKRIFANTR